MKRRINVAKVITPTHIFTKAIAELDCPYEEGAAGDNCVVVLMDRREHELQRFVGVTWHSTAALQWTVKDADGNVLVVVEELLKCACGGMRVEPRVDAAA